MSTKNLWFSEKNRDKSIVNSWTIIFALLMTSDQKKKWQQNICYLLKTYFFSKMWGLIKDYYVSIWNPRKRNLSKNVFCSLSFFTVSSISIVITFLLIGSNHQFKDLYILNCEYIHAMNVNSSKIGHDFRKCSVSKPEVIKNILTKSVLLNYS